MTVATTTSKVSYTGDGTNDTFAYTFKIYADADLVVYVGGVLKTLTTHYTVTNAGVASGGNVVFTTGNIPAASEKVVIARSLARTQSNDWNDYDRFPAETLEDSVDRLTFISQEQDEEAARSIKFALTVTDVGNVEVTGTAAERANKVFGFDNAGNLITTVEIGNYEGNWATGRAYVARDIVKDTSNNNIYICITSHTSSGAQPLSTNADSAKWALLVDAASATSDAAAAAASAAAAATSESNAATSETNAGTSATAAAASATAAATSETNAGTSETNAATSATAAASSASAAATSETNAATSASNASTSETNAAASQAAAATSATNAATSETNAGTSATSASTSATNAATSESNASTSATNAASSAAASASSATAAAASETNAAASEQLAEDWAIKTSGTVDGTNYSAKYWATQADVGTVATNIASVNTVGTDITNVNTVASSIGGVNSVAGSISDVTTVAGNIADVNTVAGISSDISIAATNVADISNFADVYLGPKTTDPATRNDSSALQAGDLYFNTVDDVMKVYDGAAWVAAYVSLSGALIDTNNLSDLTNAATARTNLGLGSSATENVGVIAAGLFAKADPSDVAWTKTGNGTAETQTALTVEVNGSVLTVASGTSITMPTLTAGTDYAIWLETDGDLVATADHTSPPTANARKIGGFHYAPGGNATARSGGNTTAQINEYSFWDLNFRPVCPDPRGMTLVAGTFWVDIYFAGIDAITNGTSKYNVDIGMKHYNGDTSFKIPLMFGGDGTSVYTSNNMNNPYPYAQIGAVFGKRFMTLNEFGLAAFGTTEMSSFGSSPRPYTTAWAATYVSKWGVNQVTGCLYTFAEEYGGAYYSSNTLYAGTDNSSLHYGGIINSPNRVVLGGSFDDGTNSGSLAQDWSWQTQTSYTMSGQGMAAARFACDHLQIG